MSQTYSTSQIARPTRDGSHKPEDLSWPRFWAGVGLIFTFAIISTAIVLVVCGVRAGADYGLLVIILALGGTLVDGVILARRRARSRGRSRSR